MAFPHRTAPLPEPLGGRRPARRGRRRRPRRTGRRAPTAPRRADARLRDPQPRGRTDDRSTAPRQRTGGRDARRAAARSTPHVAREPFLTRTLAPFEVLGEEGLAIIEHERRHDPRGGRARVPRRRRRAPRCFQDAGADVQGERVRFPRGLARQLVQATAPRQFTQYARNEANNVEIGGDAHGPRPELRLAVRPRPRQRPALRHDRGLPELREARVHEPAPPPQRRDGLRAGRRAGQQAPPRHGLFPHPLQRQAVHGLRHRAGAGPRHRRDGADRVRGGLPRDAPGHPLA